MPSDDETDANGFSKVSAETLDVTVSMTKSNLVGFLTTQTNVIAAVQSSGTTVDSAIAWLDETVPADRRADRFVFENSLSIFRCSS